MTARITKIAFDALVLIAFTYAAITATTFTPGGRWLPLVVSIIGGILAAINVGLDALGAFSPKRKLIEEDARQEVEFNTDVRSALYWFGWMVGFAILIFLFGFLAAAPVWLGLFLRINAKKRWLFTIISVVVLIGVLVLIKEFLPLEFPEGLLFTIG